MDLSKYAALFLAESREHLSACDRLLLEWERDPTSTRQVGGLFRAIHTVKGMAATMGYAGVADNVRRPEVDYFFPGYGVWHGFDYKFPIPPQPTTVCVYVLNVGNGGPVLLGCGTV